MQVQAGEFVYRAESRVWEPVANPYAVVIAVVRWRVEAVTPTGMLRVVEDAAEYQSKRGKWLLPGWKPRKITFRHGSAKGRRFAACPDGALAAHLATALIATRINAERMSRMASAATATRALLIERGIDAPRGAEHAAMKVRDMLLEANVAGMMRVAAGLPREVGE